MFGLESSIPATDTYQPQWLQGLTGVNPYLSAFLYASIHTNSWK